MPKQDHDTDDGLPSYADSVSVTQDTSPSLPRDLRTIRKSLVSSLLTKHITSHIQTSVLCGLSSTTLILIPSNVIDLNPPTASSEKAADSAFTFPGEKLVGFPVTGNLSLLRLHEPENSTEFWRQPAVLQVLEQQLSVYLEQEGYHVAKQSDLRRTEPGSVSSSSSERSANKEWKTMEAATLREGEVRVGAEMKEICLRVENAMGLYETRTGKALVITVDVGG